MGRLPSLPLLLAMGPVLAGCDTFLDLRSPLPGSDSPVQAVRATAGSGGTVIVTWSDALGASGYDLYAGRQPSVSPNSFEQRFEAVASPFPVPGLDSGSEWFFTVVAHWGGAEQPPSARVSTRPVGTGDDAPPLAYEPAWSATFPQTDARFGYPVKGAGDVDGDGFGDVLVGAYNYDGPEDEEGIVFLYRGGPAGLVEPPIWSHECDQAGAHCGTSIVAGDFDGDLDVDLVVGASDFDNGESNEGVVEFFAGFPGGVATMASFILEGGENGGNMGRRLGRATDVNGDGRDELLVPTHGYTNGQNREGRLQLFSVTGAIPTPIWTAESNLANALLGWSVDSGDMNGDGYLDVAAGGYFFGRAQLFLGTATVPSTAPSWTHDQTVGDLWTTLAVADVNGDGFDDLLLGTPFWDEDFVDEGRVEVFHGSAGGLPSTASWSALGGEAGAFFGGAIANAGDLDANGTDDVLIGAYGAGGDGSGSAGLYYGSPAGLPALPQWSRMGETPGQYFGGALGSAGDVNGDGRKDVLVGVQEDNDLAGTLGGAWLFFGPPLEGPVPALGTPTSIASGGSIPPPSASFADPAPPTTHVCTLTWGDGSAPVTVDPCDASALGASTHAFEEPGRYVVRVRVENGYGLAGETTTVVTVAAP